jgi:hypothetical protein
MKDIAEQIFLAGVDAVLPEKLIRSQVKLSGDFCIWRSGNSRYPVSDRYISWQPEKRPPQWPARWSGSWATE